MNLESWDRMTNQLNRARVEKMSDETRFFTRRSVADISKPGKPQLGNVRIEFVDSVTLETQYFTPVYQESGREQSAEINRAFDRFKQRCYAVEYWETLSHETRQKYRCEYNRMFDETGVDKYCSVKEYTFAKRAEIVG